MQKYTIYATSLGIVVFFAMPSPLAGCGEDEYSPLANDQVSVASGRSPRLMMVPVGYIGEVRGV